MEQPDTVPVTAPTHLHRIARAATLVMVLFIASRALGLLREVVIAHQFGTSAELDAYLAAFRLPDFLFYVVAGGALGSAFVPTFTGYLAREDMPGAWRLASATLNWIILILTGLGGLAALFAPRLVQLFYSDFSPAQQALTAELMRWMLISTVIFGASGVVMAILNARQHFFLPALAPVLYNGAIILGAWLLGPAWGVRGLAAGVVLGAAAHLLVQLPGLARHGMRYRPALAWRDTGLAEVGWLMAPRVLGLAAVQINFVVNAVLAARLVEGSLAALNYGWIIMLLPQGIIAQSVATALFPTLATLAARQEWAEFRRILAVTLRNLLFLTLPAAAGLVLLRAPVARLLERGAFTAESTAMTAWALGFFALGLVGHSVVEIITRAFYALKDTRTPVGVSVAAMAVNVVLSLLLVRLFAGLGWLAHGGLALANSAAVTLEMAVLLVLLRPRLAGLAGPDFGPALARMGLATAAMAVVLALLQPLVPAEPGWLGALVTIPAGGLVYLGLAYALGLDELRLITRRIRQRLAAGRGR